MVRFLGMPWLMWGLVCLIIGLINMIMYPRQLVESAARASTLQYMIVRWVHPLVWVFLAASCFLRMVPRFAAGGVSNTVALIGGLLYVLFLVTAAVTRRS